MIIPTPPAIEIRFLQKGRKAPMAVAITNQMLLWQRAREWNSRMRDRNRWIGDEKLRTEVTELSRTHLAELNVDESKIVTLARAKIIEILEDAAGSNAETDLSRGIWGTLAKLGHWVKTALLTIGSREVRRMPWESLLTMAVGKFQTHERLLVYRRLGGLPDRQGTFALDPLKALFVESAPGKLWDVYDFAQEFKAVQTYLKGVSLERQTNLSLEELRAHVERTQPSIIHLCGVDGYQGFGILENPAEGDAGGPIDQVFETHPSAVGPTVENPGTEKRISPSARPQEGVYFSSESGKPSIVSPEDLAKALCAGNKKPLLVTYNVYNSSARLAAATVTNGAAAAIGFQDFIDDTVSEIFFANLFLAWSGKRGTPLLNAFREAVRELDPYLDKVRGSGVTLWTSEPLLTGEKLSLPPLPRKLNNRKSSHKSPPLVLEFDVRPYPALNYSVLHNGKRKMFEAFRIYKFSDDRETDLLVEVNLSIRSSSFSFQQRFKMKHHILDLTDRIAVGLTSSLSRSLRESVRTTIFVRITVGAKEEWYCETFDISLLAVDEWIDDQRSGIFLPSFVLPRDPVIPQVIVKAQRYLMALADDATQGFDGYQSCEDGSNDLAGALEPQVRAIWYALQHDYALKYINPPPTFTRYSQRLRTPSDVLKGGRGTCVDLTLLLAACFEHIGLYPLIFLLTGHAFVGYWTDESRRAVFRATRSGGVPKVDPQAVTAFVNKFRSGELHEAESLLPPVEWQFDRYRRKEIQEAVECGDIMALEATYLTNGGSFVDACEVGTENLTNDAAFESMMDIALAREKGVTPLPLAVEEGEE